MKVRNHFGSKNWFLLDGFFSERASSQERRGFEITVGRCFLRADDFPELFPTRPRIAVHDGAEPVAGPVDLCSDTLGLKLSDTTLLNLS